MPKAHDHCQSYEITCQTTEKNSMGSGDIQLEQRLDLRDGKARV